MPFKSPVPILRSFDEAKTRAFYRDFLEFKVTFQHRHEPDLPLYMGVRRGDCVLHLSEHFGDGSPGAAIMIEVADVRDLCASLTAKNDAHARPGVEERPWGHTDMTINDPAGNRLIFFTPTHMHDSARKPEPSR